MPPRFFLLGLHLLCIVLVQQTYPFGKRSVCDRELGPLLQCPFADWRS